MITPIRAPWGGTMTQRERFVNQMHYKEFDRTVNMEFGYWDENYSEWDIFRDNGIKTESQANEFFSFEPPASTGGNYWLCPGFSAGKIDETADRIIMINSDGNYEEVAKDGHSTIPHFLHSSVETPDDWKKVKAERFVVDDEKRKPDVESLVKRFPSDRSFPAGVNVGSLIGKIRDMLGVEGLTYAVYDYPEMVEDMVECVTQTVENYLNAVLPHVQFDYACGWEDICCKNGPLVPMDFFIEAVFPRYKRIGNILHKHGIDIWYTDCDGDVRPLLPYFLEAGINCLFPYEVNSCLHPKDLLDEYGKDLRLMGGFDKMQLIAGKKEIKAYMESIAPLVERGGYIPFCDHRCPPDVTPENYLYYLDLKKEMFNY